MLNSVIGIRPDKMTTYVALFRLKERKLISIGALGKIDFKSGLYAYVGSAKKGLSKRLERHMSKKKKLHWHIDYFSIHADFLRPLLSSLNECEAAGKMAFLDGKPILGFGVSDCNCSSHLFFFEKSSENKINNNLPFLFEV